MPPMASKKTEIQVVGPSNGRCRKIVNAAAKHIENETARDFEVVVRCSQGQQQIGDSDGIFFLFLHPTHSNYSNADILNRSVVEGLIDWILQSLGPENNTYLIYEGVEQSMSDPITDELEKHGLLDAKFREYTVDKGETSSIYKYMVSNSNSIL